MSRRWKLFLLVGPLTMILDQVTKVWARSSLPTTPQGYGIPQSVIDGWWDWRLSHNPGSAFGLFGDTGGARVFLSIVGLIAVGAIVWMLKKATDEQRRLAVALGLVAGGAVGNLIDRVAFGVVTDFVVWKYNTHEWPTFNVADVALVVGVGLLFLDIGKQPEPAAAAAAEKTGKKPAKSGKKPAAKASAKS
jgi:signal peptidase II